MKPRLTRIGAVEEGLLQAGHEEGNALKLLFVELIGPRRCGASLLAASNEYLGHICRAS